MFDELIEIPTFLAAETGDYGVMPACSFCAEVACETAAMTCGQCSGQSCGGQCSVKECGVAQCGQCDINETGCGPQCFQCGTCESCQSSECKLGECILCQSGQCGSCEKCQGCQSSCERNCQDCEGCESACERTSQNPSANASLSITGGPGELTWKISGLSKPFNSDKGYAGAGITRDRFTVGGVSSITGIIDYESAPSSGTSTTVSHTISYDPGTYIFWGFTETKLGGYWPTGSSVTVTVGPEVIRPDDWSWGYSVKPGARLPTAREWDDFCDCINEFRDYRDLSTYTFTRAYPGPTVLTATMVNQAIKAIKAMSPPIAPPDDAVKNVTKLSADLLNELAASLNSIR